MAVIKDWWVLIAIGKCLYRLVVKIGIGGFGRDSWVLIGIGEC